MRKAVNKELSWLAFGTGLACLAMGKRSAAGSFGAIAAGLVAAPAERFTFAEKTVVITGGSRGLGLALAKELVGAGANVALLARDGDELTHAKTLLGEAFAGQVYTRVCDVTDCQRVALSIEDVAARFGGIDVWINNAGAITVGEFDAMVERDYETQFNLHLRAVIGITQLLVPYFRARGGGRMINVSSIAGELGVPHLSAYATSKHALAGFTESISPELARDGIVCTIAYPGLMNTGSPIQAVFNGEVTRQFAWFAAADVLPGLSITAGAAARRILRASADGQTEVTVGAAARVARFLKGTLPETYALGMRSVARLLPHKPTPAKISAARPAGGARRASLTRFLDKHWFQRGGAPVQSAVGQSKPR